MRSRAALDLGHVEVAYLPQSELANIEEFDDEMVKELRNRARDVLLTWEEWQESRSSRAG